MKASKIILALIILAMFLYATNPTKADFVEYSKTEMSDYVIASGVTSNSFIDQLIAAVAGQATAETAEILCTRNDYVFFSTYEISNLKFNYKYLGAVNKFFLIEDLNDPGNINNLFKDIVNILSKRESIEEDQYMIYTVDIAQTSDIEIRIESISGPDFEMLVFDKSNFDKYKKMLNGEASDNIKVLCQYELTTKTEQKYEACIGEGTYYVVVDNTDEGKILPPLNFENDSITYEINIDIK